MEGAWVRGSVLLLSEAASLQMGASLTSEKSGAYTWPASFKAGWDVTLVFNRASPFESRLARFKAV